VLVLELVPGLVSELELELVLEPVPVLVLGLVLELGLVLAWRRLAVAALQAQRQ
jgi:hypothetical protein